MSFRNFKTSFCKTRIKNGVLVAYVIVEMQAVFIGDGIRKKTNIIEFEISKSLNGKEAPIVGGEGQYCPLLKFTIDENGSLFFVSADETEKIEIDLEEGRLNVVFPQHYAIESIRKTKNGNAEVEITLEEERVL